MSELKESNEGQKPAESTGPKISYFTLYRYASTGELFMISAAIIASILTSLGLPVSSVIFGKVLGAFIMYGMAGPTPPQQVVKTFNADLSRYCLYFALLAACAFICGYLMMCLWTLVGEKLSKKIRIEYFKAILRQEKAWIDKESPGELAARVASDTQLIQDGMSDKCGICIQSICGFLSSYIIGFYHGPQLSGMLLIGVVVIFFFGFLFGSLVGKTSKAAQEANGKASSLAEEVISSIRVIFACNTQSSENGLYARACLAVKRLNTMNAIWQALMMGSIFGTVYMVYALAFWYGTRLLEQGIFTNGGDIFQVVFAIVIGTMSLGTLSQHLSTFATAVGAGVKVFELIDRVPLIDNFPPANPRGKSMAPKISDKPAVSLRNVTFAYPSRPENLVFKNLNLVIKPGEKLAIVGASGSGKSTLFHLLTRHYDPQDGVILVDGVPLQDLDLEQWRMSLGIVSQSPVLFDTTIRENLALGPAVPGQPAFGDAEIKRACHDANIHEFITGLPKGYDTPVGENGRLLSGGQKQRLSIARALVRRPKILFLDEATSALDTASERLVQGAIDNISRDITTITIAHRLSTVRHADRIIVMEAGEIVEQGTHDELMSNNEGIYHQKVSLQLLRSTDALNQQESDATDALKMEAEATAFGGVDDAPMVDVPLTNTFLIPEMSSWQVIARIIRLAFATPLAKVFGVIGFIAAICNGLLIPAFTFAFAEINSAYALPSMEETTRLINMWSLVMTMTGIGCFVFNGLMSGTLGWVGECLVFQLKTMAFKSILSQELDWFDVMEHESAVQDKEKEKETEKDKHATGATGILVTQLSRDPDLVKGLSGTIAALMIQTLVTLIIGLVLAFIYGWLLSLIIFGLLPFIALSGYLEMSFLNGFGDASKKAYEKSGRLALQSLQHLTAIHDLCLASHFLEEYSRSLAEPYKIGQKKALIASLSFGFAQSMQFIGYCVAYYAGHLLVLDSKMTIADMNMTIYQIIFSTVTAGQIASFMPQVSKAVIGGRSLFKIIDRMPASSLQVNPSGEIVKPSMDVPLKFQDVKFTYKSRPTVRILNNCSLTIEPGKTTALVGASGSGKTTLFSLIEKFYPSHGIKLGSIELSDIDTASLRSCIGLVQQEPVLFSRSIHENIAYGMPNATREQVIEAAKRAYIHEWIETLPEGYDTHAGTKGTLASGGQRQRLVLARCFLSDPRLLLLDEATSALDSTSEAFIQRSLEELRKDRTCVVIAHRLSTIQDADVIHVMEKGRVVESGSHEYLSSLKGVYADLVAKQNL